jgi:hypothetical protein
VNNQCCRQLASKSSMRPRAKIQILLRRIPRPRIGHSAIKTEWIKEPIDNKTEKRETYRNEGNR